MSAEDHKDPVNEKAASGSDVAELSSYDAEGNVVEKEQVLAVEEQVSEQEFARLRRRIDYFLIPLLMLVYGLQFADKGSLSSGVVFGLKDDTHLVGQDYAWLTTIFYLAFLVFEFPLAWALQKLPLGRLLSTIVILWGAVVMCLAACNNWASLMACRAILGALEAAVTPGFLLIVASWYKRSEHSSRSMMFFLCNAAFTFIFSLIIYGIAQHTETHGGIAGWRAINLFLGAVTVAAGIACVFILGTPEEVRWLSKEQKLMAKARIVADASGSGAGGTIPWNWAQARATFRDPQLYWVIAFNFVATVPSGALGTFGILVYSGFGFTNLESVLYNLPSSVLQVAWLVICMFTIKRYPHSKFWISLFSTVVPFTGFLALGTMDTATNKWTKWVLYQSVAWFTAPTFIIWGLLPNNTAGRTRKSVTGAAMMIAYCVGQMVGSQTYRSSDAPRYTRGLTVTSVFFGIQFFILLAWKWWYTRENRARDREAEAAGITPEERERLNKIAALEDKTDAENRLFRYDC